MAEVSLVRLFSKPVNVNIVLEGISTDGLIVIVTVVSAPKILLLLEIAALCQ